jgi:hypothetical protein
MNKKLQYQENCYYLFTMSIPIPSKTKTDFRSAIVSSIFLERLELDQYEFLKRMTLLNLNKFNFVFISSKATEIFWTQSRTYYRSTLTIDSVNLNYFFSFEGLNQYFQLRKEENYEIVYCIEGLSWHKICGHFALAFIDIPGGSNNKKHLLSPHQYRLSQFLTCLYGNKSSSKINESFHRIIKDKKSLQYSTKSMQNDIINFAESNEILKARLLSSKSVLNKSNLENQATPSLNDNTINNDNTILASPNEETSSISLNKTSINNINQKNKDSRKFHTSTRIAHLLNSEKAVVSDQLNNILVAPQPPKLNNNLDKTKKN